MYLQCPDQGDRNGRFTVIKTIKIKIKILNKVIVQYLTFKTVLELPRFH